MFVEVLQRLLGSDPVAAERALREAELSHDDTRKALADALRAEKAAAGMDKVYCWPREVYDDRVIYEMETPTGTHLYQRGYSLDDAGAITLATDVTEVKAQTVYEPVASAPPAQGPEPVAESAAVAAIERAFTADQRKELAAKGQAMSDGGFPIVTVADLRNAVAAYGRAANKAAAKRHIIKRARALKAVGELPDDWNVSEAADSDEADDASELSEAVLTGDIIPLVEKSVRSDGTVPLKVIQPGWGSSGYYDAKVLERDGASAFPKGTKMFWNHPTVTEEADRPERDLRDLAAETVSDARFVDDGLAGPGLYADAKVFKPYRETVEELAPHIGTSIRTQGTAKHGVIEGKSGPVVESLLPASPATSIDFVTTPGAGGQVLQLFEAARGGRATPAAPSPVKEDTSVSEELSEAARQRFDAQEAEIARLREVQIFREARDVATAAMARYDLPDVTRSRLVESLAKNPPIVEESKTLDVEALTTKVEETVKAEVEYLARAAGIGDGQVRGMGGSESSESISEADAETEMVTAFQQLGLSESAAKIAAGGREH